MTDVPTFQLLIGGKLTEAKTGQWTDIVSPADGEVVGRVPTGGPDDAQAALTAARRCFESKDWQRMDGGKRGYLLNKLSGLVRKNANELAELEANQMGKPIREAKMDMGYVANTLQYHAGLADKIEGSTIQVPGPRFDYVTREAQGVTLHIAPWNYPLLLAVRGIAPALAAGNTVVLKPASWTPLTALRFAELAQEAGFPEGAVNVVSGPGSSLGDALVTSPEVDSITFTGSVETGRGIMRKAAEHVVPVTLELGGKSPQVVLEDADLDAAVKATGHGIFQNAGQMCWATSRLLIHEDLEEEYLEKLQARAEKTRIGHPLDESTHMGPLVRPAHRDDVHGFVQTGTNEGATLLTGGEAPEGDDYENGAYYRPTILTNVDRKATVAQQEIFGPVLSTFTFSDENEALELANDSTYGLLAGVWTRDVGKAFRFADQLQAGMIMVNEPPMTFPQTPFTGFKQSGIGSEQGMDAVLAYTRKKNVTISTR